MPRANRYFLPAHVWQITHRCHQKQFKGRVVLWVDQRKRLI